MSISTPLYNQLLSLLSHPRQLLQVGEPAQRTASQHSQYQDLRHLKALAWMINGLICSSKINLSEWESYVINRATQAQSIEAAHTRSSRASRRLEGISPRLAAIHSQPSN